MRCQTSCLTFTKPTTPQCLQIPRFSLFRLAFSNTGIFLTGGVLKKEANKNVVLKVGQSGVTKKRVKQKVEEATGEQRESMGFLFQMASSPLLGSSFVVASTLPGNETVAAC